MKEEINYEEIDEEIRELVFELNKVKGLSTYESCYGHNKKPCMIWFVFDKITDLNSFLHGSGRLTNFPSARWSLNIETCDILSSSKELKLRLESTTKDVDKSIEILLNDLILMRKRYGR